ncbi:MAG: polyprenyl synthetase family protein [Pirellulales bacterium]|nr:polyprenyl synthetase family protein [Pirellulales bacterium]
MASVPTETTENLELAEGHVAGDSPAAAAPQRRKGPRRRRTAHLKDVPPSLDLRIRLREICQQALARIDSSQQFSKDELEVVARELLTEHKQPEGYLGWMMVVLSSEFWREQVAAVPPSRRLLLLPHCLKHAEGCPADYDQFGLDCKKCGACSIADFRIQAEELGYKVLVAEGSPIVMKIIISGYVDAIIGVACLNVLEKAIDKVLLAGVPSMAVPLLSSDCRNTSVDEDWVHELIHVRRDAPSKRSPTYLHLLRLARQLFEPDHLAQLAPRQREANVNGVERNGAERDMVVLDGAHTGDSSPTGRDTEMEAQTRVESRSAPFFGDPVAATEQMAYDFIAQGGKYARPFITLAAYDAMTGGKGVAHDGARHLEQVPDAVRRVALSIETFHKASLVHDDIEDDDDFRYGQPAMHRVVGVPAAVNVGDYMIGLGYRLVSRDVANLGPEVAGEILDRLADAHLRLSEGQGAELVWRDGCDKQLKPLDALKIYALKTAPAFEAALLCGIRCAEPLGELEGPLKQFSKHLGIAFQILNDLKDWQGDQDNKLSAGLDTLGGRPTLLWALALEALAPEVQAELLQLVGSGAQPDKRVARVEQLYREAGVFDKAHNLVDKYQERAERIADGIEPESLRRLLYYLIDTVLDKPPEAEMALVTPVIQAEALGSK